MKFWITSLVAFFLFYNSPSRAQFVLNWEPDVSVTWKANDRWSFNGRFIVLQRLHQDPEEEDPSPATERLDWQFFADYRTFGGTRFSGGYMYRHAQPFFEEDHAFEHRLMQQFGWVQAVGKNRFGHRFRTEQRIRRDEFVNRWRYRVSLDFPLQGEELDPGEKYLIFSNEVMYSFNAVEHFAENRIYAGFGWFFNKTHKMESGIQYRLEDIGVGTAHAIHVITSYYLNY